MANTTTHRRKKFGLPEAVALIAVLALGSLAGASIYKTPDQKANLAHSEPNQGGPARPVLFKQPLKLEAAATPLYPGEAYTLTSSAKWEGKQVNIYAVPGTEANQTALYEQHQLPSAAKLLGTVPVQNGTWKLHSAAPQFEQQENGYPYHEFLLAARSDTGEFSALSVMMMDYGQLALSASAVQLGQMVTLSGSGFPQDSDVWVRLEQETPTNTALDLADFGTHPTKNGAFELPFRLADVVKDKTLAPGSYKLNVVIIPKNEQRWGLTVPLEVK